MNCIQCGKPTNQTMYCNKTCYNKHQYIKNKNKTKEIKQCEICGEPIIIKRYDRRSTKYCNKCKDLPKTREFKVEYEKALVEDIHNIIINVLEIRIPGMNTKEIADEITSKIMDME
jgi:hypothetical protein